MIKYYEFELKKSNLSEDDIVWLSLVLKSSIKKFQFTIKYYYDEEVDDQTRESEAEKFFNHDFNIRIYNYLALHKDFRPDHEKLKNIKKLCIELFTSIFNKALRWIDYDLCFSNEILSVYLQRFINVTSGDHTFEAPFFNEHPKKLFGDF